MIRLHHVYKRFDNGTLALNDLDLSIHAGEFVSLLGPSGCGKSTALRLIAGLLEPTSGSIVIHGQASPDSTDKPKEKPNDRRKLNIGFVFQDATLMPWATVFDNVYLPLRLSGKTRKQAKPEIDSLLASVGLERFTSFYPRELSGGMKMRVSIARAMVTRPSLLLMDEPFAALDEITRFRLNHDVLDLWQALDLTVVFVTHSVYESVYLSNRILVMGGGNDKAGLRVGGIVAEVPIDAPYPRGEDHRTSPEYGHSCRTVLAELHKAMGTTGTTSAAGARGVRDGSD